MTKGITRDFEEFLRVNFLNKNPSSIKDDIKNGFDAWLISLQPDEWFCLVKQYTEALPDLEMLEEKSVRDFLWSFFQPDITGNEQKVELLTRQLCSKFSAPTPTLQEFMRYVPKKKKLEGYISEYGRIFNSGFNICRQQMLENFERGGR